MICAFGCTEKTCPTIGCRPRITIDYGAPIDQAYSLEVTVGSFHGNVSCPQNIDATAPGVDKGTILCDSSQFSVLDVNLGHGDVSTVSLDVKIVGMNGQDLVPLTTIHPMLTSIQNSTDCDVPCYQHHGTLAIAQ